jgi:hypothetical protein
MYIAQFYRLYNTLTLNNSEGSILLLLPIDQMKQVKVKEIIKHVQAITDYISSKGTGKRRVFTLRY